MISIECNAGRSHYTNTNEADDLCKLILLNFILICLFLIFNKFEINKWNVLERTN